MPGDRFGTLLAQITLFPNKFFVFLCCSRWTVETVLQTAVF